MVEVGERAEETAEEGREPSFSSERTWFVNSSCIRKFLTWAQERASGPCL